MLEQYAAKLKVSKNKIIEDALKRYMSALKRAEFTRGFSRAAKDREQVLLAEEGLDDFLEIVRRYEAG